MNMRALVLTQPGQIEVQSRPIERPQRGEVLIRVVATGICGSDIHGYAGETGRRVPGQVMGHESSGLVEELGEGIDPDALPVGTPVTFNPVIACGRCDPCLAGKEQICTTTSVIGVDPTIQASFAEFVLVPSTNVVPLEGDLDVVLGALIEPLTVGFHAALRGGCSEADAVVVIGGGPIGQACYLAARRLGVTRIVVSELVEHRRDLLGDLGATAFDPRQEGFVKSAIEHLGGPADLVLDAVGISESLRTAIALSAPGARIVLVGMGGKELQLGAYEWSTKERTLIGSFCYSADDFKTTTSWAGRNPDLLARLVEGRVGLEGAPSAFRELAEGTLDASKVLVLPNDPDLNAAPRDLNKGALGDPDVSPLGAVASVLDGEQNAG